LGNVPSFYFCSLAAVLLTTIQHRRVLIYAIAITRNIANVRSMRCIALEIPSLTLLATMLDVFEAAHSPAVHVTLWKLADIIIYHDRLGYI